MPDAGQQVYFARLILTDNHGDVLNDNFYWLSSERGSHQQLDELRPALVEINPGSISSGRFPVNIENSSDETAFFIRLKILDEENNLFLPVYSKGD